ncbi:MAG: hypothetical protein MJ078_04280 [Clostridia bacterium]|nr:hypothetical protein [Clostridia bacterium]
MKRFFACLALVLCFSLSLCFLLATYSPPEGTPLLSFCRNDEGLRVEVGSSYLYVKSPGETGKKVCRTVYTGGKSLCPAILSLLAEETAYGFLQIGEGFSSLLLSPAKIENARLL